MQDVGAQPTGRLDDAERAKRRSVGCGLRRIGKRLQAEGELRLEGGQHRVRQGIAGERVGDEPDRMSPGDLLAAEIEHVPEQAAERRAEHVQDAEGLGGVGRWRH